MNTLEAIKQEIATRAAAEVEIIEQIAPLVIEREKTLPDRFWAYVNKRKREWIEGKSAEGTAEPSKTESQGFGYKDYAVGGVCVILSMLLVKASDVRIAQSYWIQQQEQVGALQARSTIEQTNAQTQAAIAQAYSQNQVAVPLSQYVLTDYRLNYMEPPTGIDWARSFDPTVRTQIFDANRSCVGSVEGGVFRFVVDDPAVCNPNN